MLTRLFFAADHAAVELKALIIKHLEQLPNAKDFVIKDFGTFTTASVDYPDFADLACQALIPLLSPAPVETTPANPNERAFGILLCGSGQGMAMRANKYPQIRAALCWSVESARLSREHNEANVLCLSSRLSEPGDCIQMVHTFLTTSFAGGRHQARVAKLAKPVTE